MREHKYRAWLRNEIPAGMVDVDKIDFIKKTILVLQGVYLWTTHNFEDVDLLEYTGLKDCKGREIYEGDIIRIAGINAEVIYHLDGFKLKTICPQSEILSRFYSWNSCEIIGNIYKNPELLKGETNE